MRVTCERCLRRYDVPDATVKGRKIRARCKCGARVVVQDEERAAKSLAAGSQTTGSIQRPVRWFVDITSWEPIAMDMRQLVRAFDAGRVDADTLVWRKGMPDWRRLRDISELAERLVGAGADANEKNGSEPPPADLSQSNSEPPPRQSERSRTPPASYTVGARSGSEPPAADGTIYPGSTSASSISQSSDTQAGETRGSAAAVSLESGASFQSVGSGQHASIGSAPPPGGVSDRASAVPADASAGAPPSRRSSAAGSTRPHSRRGRSKTPSRPNASPAPVPSRTVTQTGLESPADAAARNSMVPPAGAASNGDGAPARTRDSRTSAAPGAPRRQASSDETPAQKPSSLSVPPGAMVEGRSRPRGRRFLAIAAVVLGGAFLLKQVATSSDRIATADRRVDAVPAPKQVEKALAPERKAASEQPMPGAPARELPPSTGQVAGELRPNVSSPTVSSPVVPHADVAAGPGRAPGAAAAPAPGSATPALNVEASAKETVGPIGAAPAVADAPKLPVREAPIAPPPATTAPVAAPRPAPAPAAVLPSPAAKPPSPVARPLPPAAKPPAPEPAAAPVAREPRPFDEALATQQFQAAVAKASACGQQGTTRGTGRVKVAIEPWGRVGRVTHLNQEFVGTPVGACITQVFQEIRLPPFDGNSRSIAGEFVVE
jgi:hypothetical protein